MQLQINSALFTKKQKEFELIAGNLRINEVKEDADFQKTINRVKNSILLNSVTFQEPTITGHQQVEKQFPPDYQNMWGGARQINIISVEFRFEGSTELFNYSPNGLSFGSSSNMRIFQPNYGNSITIEIELATLDKNTALNSARAQMEMTFSVINGNNQQAEQWNRTMEATIESTLIEKRKELLEFYS